MYFGWRIALVLALCSFTAFGASVYCFIILTHPIAQEFGWSATRTGALVSAMWLVAPVALVSGPLVKRVPPWRLAIGGLLLQALVLALLGSVWAFWQLYLLRIVMGLGKVMTLVAMPVLLTRWFSRRFAGAIAVFWAGGAVGGIVLSPATEALVDNFGWRQTTLILAVGVAVAALAAAWLAKGPSAPEEIGLALDGYPVAAPEEASTAVPASAPSRLRDISPPTAAVMCVAVVSAGMVGVAVLSQQPAVLRSIGMSSMVSAAIFGITSGGMLVGQLMIGWTLDRWPGTLNSVAVGSLFYFGLLILALLPRTPNVALASVGALTLGLGLGAGDVLWVNLTRRQFGDALFPTTYGGWYFTYQVGYALGGSVAGWGMDHLSTYGFLGLVALLYMPPALCSISLKGARKRV